MMKIINNKQQKREVITINNYIFLIKCLEETQVMVFSLNNLLNKIIISIQIDKNSVMFMIALTKMKIVMIYK